MPYKSIYISTHIYIFLVGTKQSQSTRRQSFDGSIGSVGNSKSLGNLGIGGRHQQSNDIPGLPSNGAPYGYDDYQYMNNNNNNNNQGMYNEWCLLN